LRRGGGAISRREHAQRLIRRHKLDDWPRTTRVLPWMLAAFMAMLWLVPFNTISMTVSLPFDIHLDRIVLPFIVGLWALSLAAGGIAAPRLRISPVHVAVICFVLLALVSLVVNVGSLNESLELNTSLKKLTLLISYVSLFVVVASVVRRSEVAAFLKYTLVLAVICSVGMLWEYHFHQNLFYAWSAKLLPGVFEVAAPSDVGVDQIGRQQIIGPAELGLEAAAMLAMALPVAVVGVLHAKQWRHRFSYGMATCLIIAAGLSTYRKTSLVAPAIVILTIVLFRRRESIRLVPFAVVLVAAVHVFAPGSLGGVLQQLSGSQIGSVNTTQHREDAYDAIRPLVWTNPALGQGYGSYDAVTNRILDNQILDQAIEMGVIGVAAYLAMMLSVVGALAPLIRARGQRAPPALACAGGAVAFLTVSFLYDTMGFPHGPYIFFVLAGFAAVLIKPEGRAVTSGVARR
jgi:hypothetical protein